MTETKQDLQRIIDGAPDDNWTHISNNGVYYDDSVKPPYVFWVRGNEWIESEIDHITRAKKDIKARIELMEEVERLSSNLKLIQHWVDKMDSLVNGCGIEDEYYELSDMVCDMQLLE